MEIDSFCPVGIGGTCQLDTTNLKIFVGNLPSEYRSKDLFSIFSQYGSIREAVVIPDRFRIRSRCYGFVTFVEEKSVEKVFNSMPIESENRRLTIILACKNAKPRRAHFNVRHGTSGHRPLPPLNKELNPEKPIKENNNFYEKENNERIANTNSKHGNQSVPKIYSDPSLFRTANIQPITPACIQIGNDLLKKTSAKEIIKQEFPNEDIEKDFERSLRVKENKESNNKIRNNNEILDFIQIKKKPIPYSQSKDIVTTTNNKVSSNQNVSLRWQFTVDNFDCQSNDSIKNYKNNERNYYFSDNNDFNTMNNSNNKNKKLLNDNTTWNRNVLNNRNCIKESNITASNSLNNHDSLPHSSTEQNNLNSKQSLFENNYSQYFPTSISSAKIFNSSESVYSNSNSNCNNINNISNANLSRVANVMSVGNQSLLNDFSQMKLTPSNSMAASFSGIKQMADSVSTMLSH